MIAPLIETFSHVAGPIALASVGLGLLGVVAMRLSLSHSLHQKLITITLITILAAPVVVLIRPELGSFLPVSSPVIERPTETAVIASAELNVDSVTSITVPEPSIDWPSASEIAVAIWLAGTGLAFLWNLFQLFQLRRRLQRLPPLTAAARERIAACWPNASPLPIDCIRLRIDPEVRSPYSFFGIRPQLVLPASWPDELSPKQLAAVLSHEHSHLRHRDSWYSLAWRIAVACQWWNPFVWMLLRKAEHLMECRADESCAVSSQQRIDFARLLISTAKNQLLKNVPPAVQAMGSSRASTLRDRVNRLLEPGAGATIGKRWSMVLAVALVAANSVWLIGCASVSSANRLSRESIVQHLRANRAHQERAEQRVLKYTENLRGKSRNNGLVAITITATEFTRRNRNEESPITAQPIDRDEAAELREKFGSLRGARTVAYPRMLTRQGKIVTFRSAINNPYVAESTTNVDANLPPSGSEHESRPEKAGGLSLQNESNQVQEGHTIRTATETIEVEYVRIGTAITVLPTLLKSGRYHLAIDLNFSDHLGQHVSEEGDPYPMISTKYVSGAWEISDGSGIYVEFSKDPANNSKDKLGIIIAVETTEMPSDSQK